MGTPFFCRFFFWTDRQFSTQHHQKVDDFLNPVAISKLTLKWYFVKDAILKSRHPVSFYLFIFLDFC